MARCGGVARIEDELLIFRSFDHFCFLRQGFLFDDEPLFDFLPATAYFFDRLFYGARRLARLFGFVANLIILAACYPRAVLIPAA